MESIFNKEVLCGGKTSYLTFKIDYVRYIVNLDQGSGFKKKSD